MRDKLSRRKYLEASAMTGAGGIGLLAGCSSTQNEDADGGDGEATDTPTSESKQAAKPAEWIIGGSQEGSPFNTWVQGFAATVKEYSDTLRLSPQFVNGFQAANVLLNDGELDIASSWYHLLYQEQNGLGLFAEGESIGPLEKELRGISPVVHQGYWWFATYANRDNINDITDLDGKRVGLNVPNAGVTQWAQQLFDIAGIDASFSFLSIGDAGNALQSRQVDAALILSINGAILPTPMQRAFASVDMKGVPIPEDAMKQLQNANPVVVEGTVKNENLNQKGKFDSVNSFLLSSGEFTTADHDPNLVYEFISSIVDHQDELGQYHPALNAFGVGEGRNNFDGVPEGIQFHEGAIQYYEEAGIDYPR